MNWIRALLFCVSCVLLVGIAHAADAAPTDNSSHAIASNTAVVIPLEGEINDYNRDDLFRRFKQAEALGAKTVILKIDTYGGLVTSGMDISSFLRSQSTVHTIALVDRKAISAGAMIAVACDEIVMTPGARLGDCAPIIFNRDGHLEPLPVAERAKQESPIISDFYSSARRNGYDPLVAEAMVRVATVVHLIQNESGQRRAVNEADYTRLTKDGWKPAPGFRDPIDGPESLLTVDADEAKALGLSKGVATSAEALAVDRHFNVVADLTPGFGDRLVQWLAAPPMRFVFLLVFLLSLYVALHAPGHGASEAIAVVSLALLLGMPLLTGYAQWWEIVLILAGLALGAFEIFVFPGHGVSLVIGILMVTVGLLMTFVGPEPGRPWFPSSPQMWQGLQNGLIVLVSALVGSLVLAAWLRRYLPRVPIFNRLILTETSGSPLTAAAGLTGTHPDTWPFVGTVGAAVSDLKPGGTASFPFGGDTRTTAVVSSSGYVSAGTKILVQEVRGTRVVVRTIA